MAPGLVLGGRRQLLFWLTRDALSPDFCISRNLRDPQTPLIDENFVKRNGGDQYLGPGNSQIFQRPQPVECQLASIDFIGLGREHPLVRDNDWFTAIRLPHVAHHSPVPRRRSTVPR